MNEELENIARQLASVLLVCAPQFPDGSIGAKTVTLAKHIKPIIEDIKKKGESHGKKR